MKQMKVFIMLTLLATAIYSQDYEQYKASLEAGFRGVDWGASVEDVKNSQSSDIEWGEIKTDDGSTIYHYEGKIAGLSALIAYFMFDGKLYRGKYIFQEEHSSKSAFLVDFSKIHSKLEKKYGNVDTKKTWSNDLYKDDYSEWGMAVAVGHLSMFDEIVLKNMRIDHALYGDNYKITHALEYSDPVASKKIEKIKEGAEMDDF